MFKIALFNKLKNFILLESEAMNLSCSVEKKSNGLDLKLDIIFKRANGMLLLK